MENKAWWMQKSVWGFAGAGVFGVLNVLYPSEIWASLLALAIGWAGIGIANKLERKL